MNIEHYVQRTKQKVDSHLRGILPKNKSIISQAIRYAVINGGKRLRPILCITVYQGLGRAIDKKILRIASSLEFVHAFSLIQDDLPSLDNDDYRRGKPTTHKVFGEDTAILASDILLNEAYQIILKCPVCTSEVKTKLLSELSLSVKNLILGQEEDLRLLTRTRITLDVLNEVNRGKTAALLIACFTMPAILRGRDNDTVEKLRVFGEKVGLAYQILDDVLNVTAAGKAFKGKRFSDQEKGRVTYVSAVGISKSLEIAQGFISEAKEGLRKIPYLNTRKVWDLCDFILKRTY